MEPAIRAARHELAKVIQIRCAFGRLFPGANARIIGDGFQEHLKNGVPLVEELSQARFGANFMKNIVNNPNYVYETSTASRAISAIARVGKVAEIDVLLAVQKMFFVEGLSANEISNYLPIAQTFGVSARALVISFYSVDMDVFMQRSFEEALEVQDKVGVRTLPAFAFAVDGSLHALDHEALRDPINFVAAIKEIVRAQGEATS